MPEPPYRKVGQSKEMASERFVRNFVPLTFFWPLCILGIICSAVPCLKGGYSQGVDIVVYRHLAKR
jgi:hypothetical protein